MPTTQVTVTVPCHPGVESQVGMMRTFHRKRRRFSPVSILPSFLSGRNPDSCGVRGCLEEMYFLPPLAAKCSLFPKFQPEVFPRWRDTSIFILPFSCWLEWENGGRSFMLPSWTVRCHHPRQQDRVRGPGNNNDSAISPGPGTLFLKRDHHKITNLGSLR